MKRCPICLTPSPEMHQSSGIDQSNGGADAPKDDIQHGFSPCLAFPAGYAKHKELDLASIWIFVLLFLLIGFGVTMIAIVELLPRKT
jgi:hypothetical protein